MLSRTQIAAIDDLADRIETAYLRKHPQRPWNGPDPRLWELVARSLIEAHRSTPWLPVDPELFVACQPASSSPSDPWAHLATEDATQRYLTRVKRMVRRLRREIRGEVELAEEKLKLGISPEEVLRMKSRAISPLGRFLVAMRANRPDLAERFRVDAEEQHAACPLYRVACRRLISEESYPVVDLVPGITMTHRPGPAPTGVFLN